MRILRKVIFKILCSFNSDRFSIWGGSWFDFAPKKKKSKPPHLNTIVLNYNFNVTIEKIWELLGEKSLMILSQIKSL